MKATRRASHKTHIALASWPALSDNLITMPNRRYFCQLAMLWLLLGYRLALADVTPIPTPGAPPAVEVSAATLAADSAVLTDPDKLNQFCYDMGAIYRRGHWDELVARITPILDKLPSSDPRLAYYRGCAAYEIGSYALTTQDLTPLGDYAPFPRWRSASSYVIRVADLRRLCPPHVYDMSFDGKVIFRVYYDEADAWTNAIVSLLPQAYRVNRKLLGYTLSGTPVLIFKDYDRFKQFYSTRSQGRAPGSWVWAAGNSGLLYFCEASANGPAPAASPISNYMRSTVSHEYDHCLVNRLLGGVRMPRWLEEGIAQIAGGRAAPALLASNQDEMRRVVAANHVLSIDELGNSQHFNDDVEAGLKDRAAGLPVADPYGQGYSMARSFTTKISDGKLALFLLDLREQRRFPELFTQYTGWTLPQFYDAWLDYQNKLIGRTTATTPASATAP